MAIYKGLAFPFRKGKAAFPEPAEDSELLLMSLKQLVSTSRRERLMRPLLGTSAIHGIFEPNTASESSALEDELLRTDLAQLVGRYEPRVILRQVNILREDDAPNATAVEIVYAEIATRQQRSFMLDFAR